MNIMNYCYVIQRISTYGFVEFFSSQEENMLTLTIDEAEHFTDYTASTLKNHLNETAEDLNTGYKYTKIKRF